MLHKIPISSWKILSIIFGMTILFVGVCILKGDIASPESNPLPNESSQASTNEQPQPAGIFEGAPPPTLKSSITLVNNGWQGILGGNWIYVYAGASPENIRQGVIAVLRIPSQEFQKNSWAILKAPIDGLYKTPKQSGSVTVIAVNNALLTLEAENGDHFVFDVAARKFVSP